MKHKKDLVLHLIKDDLINTRLVKGLSDLGLEAGKYNLRLSHTFLNMMGFANIEQDEEIYERYFLFAEKAATVDLSENSEQLDKMALEVYEQLMTEKKKRKHGERPH